MTVELPTSLPGSPQSTNGYCAVRRLRRLSNAGAAAHCAAEHDALLTRWGRLLRRLHLDWRERRRCALCRLSHLCPRR